MPVLTGKAAEKSKRDIDLTDAKLATKKRQTIFIYELKACTVFLNSDKRMFYVCAYGGTGYKRSTNHLLIGFSISLLNELKSEEQVIKFCEKELECKTWNYHIEPYY